MKLPLDLHRRLMGCRHYPARAMALDWLVVIGTDPVPWSRGQVITALGVPPRSRRNAHKWLDELVEMGVVRESPEGLQLVSTGFEESPHRVSSESPVSPHRVPTESPPGPERVSSESPVSPHRVSSESPVSPQTDVSEPLCARALREIDREKELTPPYPPGGAGLWEVFDHTRAAEYLEVLWSAWGPGHPSPGWTAQARIAERLQRWLGSCSPSERETRVQALVAWLQGPYQPRDKVRALLSGDWDAALRPPPAEERRERRDEPTFAQHLRPANEVLPEGPSRAEAMRIARLVSGIGGGS